MKLTVHQLILAGFKCKVFYQIIKFANNKSKDDQNINMFYISAFPREQDKELQSLCVTNLNLHSISTYESLATVSRYGK